MAANTTAVLVAASSSPPSAGPTNVPALSIVLELAFAAVSCCGVRARSGSRAAWAGAKGVAATVPITASA